MFEVNSGEKVLVKFLHNTEWRPALALLPSSSGWLSTPTKVDRRVTVGSESDSPLLYNWQQAATQGCWLVLCELSRHWHSVEISWCWRLGSKQLAGGSSAWASVRLSHGCRCATDVDHRGHHRHASPPFAPFKFRLSFNFLYCWLSLLCY